jgi:hypothetical protein
VSQLMTPEAVDGLEVLTIRGDATFGARRTKVRTGTTPMEGVHRIAAAFVDRPETILQELVNAAVDLCGADSAGISFEMADRPDASYYHWVATAGAYSSFLDAELPRYPSACGICLERGKPQMFRVGQRFFDIMGIEAPLVTDGILLPWQVDGQRGTIFVMAHGRTEAFDAEDCRMMQLLADFAALGVRQQRQQKRRLDEAKVAAAAEMANELAHQINNPLQSLTNVLFLASQGHGDLSLVGQQALKDVLRLSALVHTLLALPLTGTPIGTSGGV